MSQEGFYAKSSAAKRLMREAEELHKATFLFYAQPIEDNLYEWHFTIRGPKDSEFENGFYHGRILVPNDYPMKPLNIIILTPNGRFETNKKICLSISGYHPETWQPSWSIRTALLALIGFMPTHGGGSIGSLDYTPEERKKLALKSREWTCPECGKIRNLLLDNENNDEESTQHDEAEAKELATQYTLKPSDNVSLDETTKPTNGTHRNSPDNTYNFKNVPLTNTNTESNTTPTKNNNISPQNKESLLSTSQRLLGRLGTDSPSHAMLTRRIALMRKTDFDQMPDNTAETSDVATASKPVTLVPNRDAETTPSPQFNNRKNIDRNMNNSTNLNSPTPVVQSNNNNTSYNRLVMNICMLFLTVLLAFLIVRRIYLANEWRFHIDDDDTNEF